MMNKHFKQYGFADARAHKVYCFVPASYADAWEHDETHDVSDPISYQSTIPPVQAGIVRGKLRFLDGNHRINTCKQHNLMIPVILKIGGSTVIADDIVVVEPTLAIARAMIAAKKGYTQIFAEAEACWEEQVELSIFERLEL